MNVREAKKLNLPAIMSSLGYQPIKQVKNGLELWYLSPFREEQEPSFHTSFLGGKWIWNDFGDKGGTVIDFIMRHENLYSVGEALRFLESFNHQGDFSFQPLKKVTSQNLERDLELLSVQDIQHPSIISYLTNTRCLDRTIIQKYLKEVRYKNCNTGKEYFAFGMQNQSEGYEIRVASDYYPFKSALKKKDVTFISGKSSGKSLHIFEGMTDFLSLLTLEKIDQLEGDAIILHSTKLLDRASEFIQKNTYTQINAFFDNDPTGKKTLEALKLAFGNKVSDQSQLYHPHKDLNELLQSKAQKELFHSR